MPSSGEPTGRPEQFDTLLNAFVHAAEQVVTADGRGRLDVHAVGYYRLPDAVEALRDLACFVNQHMSIHGDEYQFVVAASHLPSIGTANVAAPRAATVGSLWARRMAADESDAQKTLRALSIALPAARRIVVEPAVRKPRAGTPGPRAPRPWPLQPHVGRLLRITAELLPKADRLRYLEEFEAEAVTLAPDRQGRYARSMFFAALRMRRAARDVGRAAREQI